MTCRDLALAALAALSIGLGSGRAIADDTAAPDPTDPIDRRVDHLIGERLRRLAAHHYRTGAYYRAISAYEELALFADDDATRRYAAIQIAMSYHHGHQLDDAIPAYRAAISLAAGDDAQALRIQLAIARAERSFAEPGAEALDAIAGELSPSTAGGSYRALAIYQLARIEAVAGRRDAARRAAADLHLACTPAAELFPRVGCSAEPLLARALARPPIAHRSPALGVTLSLVVPGSGSVYGGHLVDGLYYFALTTLSGLGALDTYRTDHRWTDQKATFYGLAALAAVFYAGSAVQGYVSVARHNAIRELEARQSVWRDTDVALPLEPTNRL
jgi:hypothetical protein